MRMWLRTSATGDAKARAAVLELERVKVIGRVEQSVKRKVGREELKPVYRIVFDGARDRYTAKQAAYPMLAAGHHASNLAYARYFMMLAEASRSPLPDDDLRGRIRDKGLSEGEADKIVLVAQRVSGVAPSRLTEL